jgi:hypothetical protein
MPKEQRNRMSELLNSVNSDLLSDLPQQFEDNTVRVERILLEMVRPDPVQPRRVLPERIHFAFHNQQLTPTQSLRELVQIAQVAARQQGRPFSNVLELLPDDEREDTGDTKLSPEEQLLRDLVNLAVTIRDDGQVNPVTVVDVSQGVTQLFRIETGERRYWATWLLRDFFSGYEGDGMLPCLIIPSEKASVFRQARENSARTGLTAIAIARQAALLLLAINGYEIPDQAVTNDFYRQALELRIPRNTSTNVGAAMGGMDRRRFSQYKNLLALTDEALELADRYAIDEGTLRHVIHLSPQDQIEMLQQVIRLNLNSKQVEAIIEQGFHETEETPEETSPSYLTKFAKIIVKDGDKFDPESLWNAIYREKGDPHMTQAYLKRLAQLALAAANRYSE